MDKTKTGFKNVNFWTQHFHGWWRRSRLERWSRPHWQWCLKGPSGSRHSWVQCQCRWAIRLNKLKIWNYPQPFCDHISLQHIQHIHQHRIPQRCRERRQPAWCRTQRRTAKLGRRRSQSSRTSSPTFSLCRLGTYRSWWGAPPRSWGETSCPQMRHIPWQSNFQPGWR